MVWFLNAMLSSLQFCSVPLFFSPLQFLFCYIMLCWSFSFFSHPKSVCFLHADLLLILIIISFSFTFWFSSISFCLHEHLSYTLRWRLALAHHPALAYAYAYALALALAHLISSYLGWNERMLNVEFHPSEYKTNIKVSRSWCSWGVKHDDDD